MAVAVTATFTQQRTEQKNFIAKKKGRAMTDEDLVREYWDKNRAAEYRSIKANAQTYVCPVAGTKYWFVPQYEMEDTYSSSQTGTMQQLASQVQNHKAAAKPCPRLERALREASRLAASRDTSYTSCRRCKRGAPPLHQAC